MSTIRPYILQIPEDDLIDLQRRLARTRLADSLPGNAWDLGTDPQWLSRLIAYWHDHFDWRAQERRINAWPQFKVTINGRELHYFHVEGKGPNPKPLLLVHGWPGSPLEFLDMIDLLTDPVKHGRDPGEAFTVVIPSLPGYHLSYSHGRGGLSIEAMADLLKELMTSVLGYERFAAQGGDWGAFITTRLAHRWPQNLIGIHLNLLPLPRNPSVWARDEQERNYLVAVESWLKRDTGYIAIQATRPQTLALALNDSPAGLAAWIGEKFRTWSDPDSPLEELFDIDALLANICLYWFTGSIGSSFWPYHARHFGEPIIPADAAITVPTAYAEFPFEFLRPPQSMAGDMFANIKQWNTMPKGGHFAAMECPGELAADLITFFATR